MTTKPENSPLNAASKPEPASPAAAPASDLPLAITHAAMNTAYDDGQAVPLAASMTWLTRYEDSWWVVYERGWLRVTDTATAQDLDLAAARLTRAESITEPLDSDYRPQKSDRLA